MKNLYQKLSAFFRPAKTRTILVVDDSPLDRTIATRALARKYHVLAADNGRFGLELARQHRPDLILLDYVMPEMDGPETCAALKADPLTEGIPVIFVTRMDEPSTFVEGMEGGAESFLTKPVKMGELIAEVDLRLKYAAEDKEGKDR